MVATHELCIEEDDDNVINMFRLQNEWCSGETNCSCSLMERIERILEGKEGASMVEDGEEL